MLSIGQFKRAKVAMLPVPTSKLPFSTALPNCKLQVHYKTVSVAVKYSVKYDFLAVIITKNHLAARFCLYLLEGRERWKDR